MRSDGDRLSMLLAEAGHRVVVAAPFIKAGVLRTLLARVPPSVPVRVVTRWRPEEVAAGVSDLECFEVVAQRPETTLSLIDALHAKLYLADGRGYAGSANLTGAALGWSRNPNLELLVPVNSEWPDVAALLAQLNSARLATAEERQRVSDQAAAITSPAWPESSNVTESAAGAPWLPSCAAPASLFPVYTGVDPDRFAAEVYRSAAADLEALGVRPSLKEGAFNREMADALRRMPAVAAILAAAEGDLTDTAGADLVRSVVLEDVVPAEVRWRVLQDWLMHFLGDEYEMAATSYVLRPRSGTIR